MGLFVNDITVLWLPIDQGSLETTIVNKMKINFLNVYKHRSAGAFLIFED